jgi:hypothetical protein
MDMRVVPRKYEPKISYYRDRVARWAAHADQIGTSAEDVAALAALTEEAREALAAQQAAQMAARSATLRLKLAMEKMGERGGGIMTQIRVRALQEGAGVYSLAGIAARKKKSPLGPPGRPYAFDAELGALGWLTLRWKCKHPRGAQGTMYQVWRRVGNVGAFERLGMSGEKTFVDKTVPAGAGVVMYKIQAVRTTAEGEWGVFEVSLGVRGGGGARLASVMKGAA